ncbi:MAG: GntP family permease [Turicibacter sp.]|nr:GntP family permease [Turicibacter sp.]
MIHLIILIVSLGTIMLLAYLGYSTIITAPIIALITLFLTFGLDSHLMANYTLVYMDGFSTFIKNYFPLFLTGAIFAKLMEETGYAHSIAHSITKWIKPKRAILAVVLSGALLTYGGVSLFVVAFVLYPIATYLFQEADIPKRLIPGTIALGAFTFTMTALPGSPEIQNVIPMTYFKTDTFAAPLIGIMASLLMFTLGLLYLNYRVTSAKKNHEGYGFKENIKLDVCSEIPSIWLAISPILIIFILNLFFSKIYYPNIDGTYLEEFNTTLDSLSGTWSVLISIVIAIFFILLVNRKRLRNLQQMLETGVKNSFVPLLNSSAIVGYGSIIKTLPIFIGIQALILNLSSNPIITESLSVNIICGLTASASGGLGITLDALAPTFLQLSEPLGITPEILHRIAALSSGGLDTLPHNGAVITTLAICGLTHKQAYKDIFVTSVLIPISVTALIVIFTSMIYI